MGFHGPKALGVCQVRRAHDSRAPLGVLALLTQTGEKPFRFFTLPLN